MTAKEDIIANVLRTGKARIVNSQNVSLNILRNDESNYQGQPLSFEESKQNGMLAKVVFKIQSWKLLGCAEASLSKWGCYETPRRKPSDSKLLFNRRNAIDWFDGWDNYLEKIVCE
jgi:hypothetical protein